MIGVGCWWFVKIVHKMSELVTEKELEIRFSEVDIMKVVWHGSYPLYLEDAREAFGAQY